MSKSVLISVNPEWCELIASGKKTIEVRKTRPKIETPFKCYIYCTANKNGTKDLLEIHGTDGKIRKANGKVIGEFVCDDIFCIWSGYAGNNGDDCLTFTEREKYLGFNKDSSNKMGFAWHISDLVIYDKTRELSEFKVNCLGFLKPYKCDKCEYDYTESNESIGVYHQCCCDNIKPLKRPPQSWCYVEEV